MAIIISIEGNIGSGKSTLLKQLKKSLPDRIFHKKIIFLQEPVKDWEKIKNEEGKTIIEKFYGNKRDWGFSFQMMAYISRLKSIKDIIKKHGSNIIILSERSLWTDKNVFAKMLYDSNDINTINYKIYNKWFDEFVEEYPLSGIIYVNTLPSISYDRVTNRSRKGENNISMNYLETCHNYHNNWITKSRKPQLEINGNGENTIKISNKCLNDIKIFIEKLSCSKVRINYKECMNNVFC